MEGKAPVGRVVGSARLTSPEPSGQRWLGAVGHLMTITAQGWRAMAERSGAGFWSFGVSQIVRGWAWGFWRVCCSPRQPWARLGLPADLLALRTSTLYVKPSPAICLSTDPVRVRRSAKIGYKAFVRTGRLSFILSGSQQCPLFSGQWGGFAAKIMKTWCEPVNHLLLAFFKLIQNDLSDCRI